jgi:hypothetical protein
MKVDLGSITQPSAHFTVQNIPFGCVCAGCNVKTLFPAGLFR